MLVGKIAAIKPLADVVVIEVLVRHEDVATAINCITPPPNYLIGLFNPNALNQAAPKSEDQQNVVQLRPEAPEQMPMKKAVEQEYTKTTPAAVVPAADEMPPMPDALNRLPPKGSPFKGQVQ